MLILLCILVVLSSKASEVVKHHYVNASDLNLLEANEAEASLAGRGAYTLMLTEQKLTRKEGISFSCLRKPADKIAASGYYMVVLDFFYGEPYDPQNTNRPLGEWLKDHGTVSSF
ncbi:hypothetical protein S83_001157 [Arachis hypogaea]